MIEWSKLSGHYAVLGHFLWNRHRTAPHERLVRVPTTARHMLNKNLRRTAPQILYPHRTANRAVRVYPRRALAREVRETRNTRSCRIVMRGIRGMWPYIFAGS